MSCEALRNCRGSLLNLIFERKLKINLKILRHGAVPSITVFLGQFGNRLVGLVTKGIAFGEGRLRFHFAWSNRRWWPTARHRCDVYVLPRLEAAEMGSATRYTLRRNTTNIVKI